MNVYRLTLNSWFLTAATNAEFEPAWLKFRLSPCQTPKFSMYFSILTRLKFLLYGLSLFSVSLSGTELQPWLGRTYEFQAKASYLFQQYQSVAVAHGNDRRHSDDSFLNLGVYVPLEKMSGEIEILLADTHHRSFGFDHVRLTGRYKWLDDVVADPISLTTGVTFIGACKRSLHDISSFHHGKFELEAHVAAGKEFSCEEFWTSRLWGLFACGIANKGSPWIRTDFAWEKNWWDVQRIRLFMHTLWGLGKRGLILKRPFHGYGAIQHDSIDLGACYSFATECYGIFSFEYSRRVYARNFPRNANCLKVSYLLPFGL